MQNLEAQPSRGALRCQPLPGALSHFAAARLHSSAGRCMPRTTTTCQCLNHRTAACMHAMRVWFRPCQHPHLERHIAAAHTALPQLAQLYGFFLERAQVRAAT